jgi:hypothetical protein
MWQIATVLKELYSPLNDFQINSLLLSLLQKGILLRKFKELPEAALQNGSFKMCILIVQVKLHG